MRLTVSGILLASFVGLVAVAPAQAWQPRYEGSHYRDGNNYSSCCYRKVVTYRRIRRHAGHYHPRQRYYNTGYRSSVPVHYRSRYSYRAPVYRHGRYNHGRYDYDRYRYTRQRYTGYRDYQRPSYSYTYREPSYSYRHRGPSYGYRQPSYGYRQPSYSYRYARPSYRRYGDYGYRYRGYNDVTYPRYRPYRDW